MGWLIFLFFFNVFFLRYHRYQLALSVDFRRRSSDSRPSEGWTFSKGK